MRFRRLYKKGQEEELQTVSPSQLMGIILGAAVIIAFLLLIIPFTKLYSSDKDKEFAINNFIALANKIDSLSKSTKQFDAQKAFPFYLPSGFVIVGFNKEWNNYITSDGCEPEAVRKPTEVDGKEGSRCKDSACLCLFKSNDHFMDGDKYNVELIQCQSTPKADYIVMPYLGTSTVDNELGKKYNYPVEIYKNAVGSRIQLSDYSSIGFSDYAFFYIYGQCDDWYWDRDLQSRKIYLDKFTIQSKIYIYIAPEHPSVDITTSKRFEIMNQKYGNPQNPS